MGSLTKGRPAEAYEIAGIQALQECSGRASDEGFADTLLPLLAMSVLSVNRALRGEAVRNHVRRIADAIGSDDLAVAFMRRAASGFAHSSDDRSAGELIEAATLRGLIALHH